MATSTLPLVAPEGTTAVISDGDITVNTAETPWKWTADTPVRFVPRMPIVCATFPVVGSVSTKGPSPTDRLKTVPKSEVPP